MELKVATDGMHEHVVIELWMDGKPLGHTQLDGATAEMHIQEVADARAQLTDPVSPMLDPNSMLDAVVDPSWRIEDYRISEGRIVAFRHPGLGWMAFVIPEEQAKSIAEWLTKDIPLK